MSPKVEAEPPGGRPPPGGPSTFAVTVLAKDPDYCDDDGKVRTVTAQIPAGWLEAGPRDHRFHVVDFDISLGVAPRDDGAPTRDGTPGWEFHDRLKRRHQPDTLRGDRALHAQHVWGVASATLARFERALGRRVEWQPPCAQLFLVPHAFPEANAYYDRESRGVCFGYVPQPGGETVYSCLSHDVVAHEVSHAVLDGLRPRYLSPLLPDGVAFHEGLADVVALLSTFAATNTVATELKATLKRHHRKSDQISEDLRASTLFGLAAELGGVYGRTGGLRRSVDLAPDVTYLERPEFDEPHRRGEVLVAAILRTLLAVWSLRITALDPTGTTYLDRAAEEGAVAAEQLLGMVLRAIDYLPPVDFELRDLLDAIVLADEVVVPTQRLDYRGALREHMLAYGIAPVSGDPKPRRLEGLQLDYRDIHAPSLRTDPAEVYRFLWQNADAIGFERLYYTDVESIEPVTRVGPDGLIVNEAIVCYTQRVDGSVAALRTHSHNQLKIPEGRAPESEQELWGGGVVVFDQFGHARLHLTKPVTDWERQTRILTRLAGFELSAAGRVAPVTIADLHANDDADW